MTILQSFFIYLWQSATLVMYVALLCPNHHLLNMKLMHKCVSYFWWCTKLSNKLKEKYIDNQIMIYVKRKKEWFCKTNIEQRPLINYYPWKLQIQFSDGYLSYSNHNTREWIKMHSPQNSIIKQWSFLDLLNDNSDFIHYI